MTDYIKSSFIIEERVNINGIPAIIFRPKGVKSRLTLYSITVGVKQRYPENKRVYLGCSRISGSYPGCGLPWGKEPLKDYGKASATEYFGKLFLPIWKNTQGLKMS